MKNKFLLILIIIFSLFGIINPCNANSYTWTNHPMEVGVAAANPDIADEDFMYLYTAIDELSDSIADESTVIALGTYSSGTATMTVNRIHTITFSGNSTIAVPTGLTSGIHYNCTLIVTMSSLVTVTQPTVTWAYGSSPALTSTSVKYRITYETVDGGTTWYGYWTQLGS